MADENTESTEVQDASSDVVDEDAVKQATRDAIAEQDHFERDHVNLTQSGITQEKDAKSSQVDDDGGDKTQTSKPTESEDDKPRKKSSGYQRLKNRHQLTIAENETLKAELEALKNGTSTKEAEPKSDDFEDIDEYNAALIKHTVKTTVQDAFGEFTSQQRQAAAHDGQEDAEAEFMSQVSDVKEAFDDFDQAMETLGSSVGNLNENLTEMLMDSDKGALILRHLGKNPKDAAHLNQLGVIEASREVGRLEATLSMPKKKTDTGAPPPIVPPKGGGSAPPPTDLAKIAQGEDMGAYIKVRQNTG